MGGEFPESSQGVPIYKPNGLNLQNLHLMGKLFSCCLYTCRNVLEKRQKAWMLKLYEATSHFPVWCIVFVGQVEIFIYHLKASRWRRNYVYKSAWCSCRSKIQVCATTIKGAWNSISLLPNSSLFLLPPLPLSWSVSLSTQKFCLTNLTYLFLQAF